MKLLHIYTKEKGYFVRETYPTGKPKTIVIITNEGRLYFAPYYEFIQI